MRLIIVSLTLLRRFRETIPVTERERVTRVAEPTPAKLQGRKAPGVYCVVNGPVDRGGATVPVIPRHPRALVTI